MKLIDKIKRRGRDIIRAAKGAPWGEWAEVRRPEVQLITQQPARVETYALQHLAGPFFEGIEPVSIDRVVDNVRKNMAKEIGLGLLEKGLITTETTDGKVRGQDGVFIRMQVKVVVPDDLDTRMEAKP